MKHRLTIQLWLLVIPFSVMGMDKSVHYPGFPVELSQSLLVEQQHTPQKTPEKKQSHYVSPVQDNHQKKVYKSSPGNMKNKVSGQSPSLRRRMVVSNIKTSRCNGKRILEEDLPKTEENLPYLMQHFLGLARDLSLDLQEEALGKERALAADGVHAQKIQGRDSY